MKRSRLGPWLLMLFGVLYFLVPLLGTFEFSLRYLRGVYSLEAYRIVLADPRFAATVTYSTALALATIVVGVVLVVPTAYWIQLRLPGLRPVGDSLRLLPLGFPPFFLGLDTFRSSTAPSLLPLPGADG